MLANENCSVPKKGGSPLTSSEVAGFSAQVPKWEIFELDSVQRMQRVYKFKNFVQALDFTNRVGEIAEDQDHHPSLTTEWGKVMVTWWTHAVGGLHRNDFIMAAKCDALYGV